MGFWNDVIPSAREFKQALASMDEPVTYPVAVAITTSSVPVAEPVPAATTDPAFRQQYQALANKLGVACGESLAIDEMREFLRENGIRIYNLRKVQAFLTSQYGEGRYEATWGWRPLRDKDGKTPHGRPDLGVNGMLMLDRLPYSKPVPLPVLLTVDHIVERFPDARFFVSDEVRQGEAIRDPFLLVVLNDQETAWFVVERWDEPNYRE